AVLAARFSAPADAAGALLRLFREWSADGPDDLTGFVTLMTAPPLPVIPEQWHGQKVAAFVAVSPGPIAEGDGQVSAFRTVAEPVADLAGPMPYTAMQSLLDPLWPKGINAYFKATNLASLDDGLIDSFCKLHLAAPGAQCEIHVHQMGGAVARVAEGAPAVPERSQALLLHALTRWRRGGPQRV